jgi:hypothetical protein
MSTTPNGVVPPRTTREGVVTCDETSVVRIRAFSPSTDLMQLIVHLRRSKSTGTIMVDLNQGGVGSIRFREESCIVF